MSAVVDMIIKPIAIAGREFPFFEFPPLSEIICGIVELTAGGEWEKMPGGIGDLIKYAKESILMIVILFVLFIKVWQYIGPKLWHLFEGFKWYPDVPSEPSGFSSLSIEKQVEYYYGQFELFISKIWNWMITTFLQIPIDIMSWDMESLSLDFGHKWGDKENFFRKGCDRFVNGSYAADYSLYEGETISQYNSHGYEDQSLQYKHSPDKYLCTHGNYCKEVSDILGQTGLGNASSVSPTNGYVNGIDISSAPRKYYACCSNAPKTNCDEHCREDSPIDIDNLKNPMSLITDVEEMILHPINTIEELLDIFLPPALNMKDYQAIECNFYNQIYDWWKNDLCKGKFNPVVCPDTVGFHKRNEGRYNGCSESWGQIGEHIREAYDKRVEHCINDCNHENNQKLIEFGCNSEYIDQAKRSTERNHCNILNDRLNIIGDIEDEFKSIIKRENPWISSELEMVLNNNNKKVNKNIDSYNRERLNKCVRGLTIEVDGKTIDCSKDDLSDSDLDKCFGPFRPMDVKSYPLISKNIIKDFLGPILWTMLIISFVFIILYILCLFNPDVGQAVYTLSNKYPQVLNTLSNIAPRKILNQKLKP
jgi:hypothetical protein